MGMEHRWSRRRPVNLAVALTYRPLGLIRAHLHNLSEGGAYVATQIALTPNTPVELVFSADEQTTTRLHRLPAVITRSDDRGAALMFTHLTPEAQAALSLRASEKTGRILPAAARVERRAVARGAVFHESGSD